MKARLLLALSLATLSGCALIDAFDGGQGADGGTPDGGHTPAYWSWQGPVQLDRSVPIESDAPRLAVGRDGAAWVVWHEWDNSLMTEAIWVLQRPAGGDWGYAESLPQVNGWPILSYPEVAIETSGDPLIAFEGSSSNTSPTRSMWAVQPAPNDIALASAVRVDTPGSRTPQISQGNTLAVDENGHAIMAWGQDDGIFASASYNGTSWTSAMPIDSNSADGWASVVTAASNGTALVGWSTGAAVLVQAITIGSGAISLHGTAQTVATGSNLPGPLVAMRGGKGLAVWRQAGGFGAQSWNGSWATTSSIPEAMLDYYPGAALAMNSSGQAVLVWRHDVQGQTDSYQGELWASFFDGTQWSTPGAISLTGANRKCWWAAVDINDAGAAVASWADFDETGTYTRIWANILRFGTGAPAWEGPVAIDQSSPSAYLANTPENVRDISVGLTPDGTLGIVTYIQHQPDMTTRTWANVVE
jgi:hypothetical protein